MTQPGRLNVLGRIGGRVGFASPLQIPDQGVDEPGGPTVSQPPNRLHGRIGHGMGSGPAEQNLVEGHPQNIEDLGMDGRQGPAG